VKDKLLQKWNRYRRKKRWWTVVLDFILLVLIVAMLIPSARKNISAFVVKNTMRPPRESSKTFILSEEELNLILIDKAGNLKTLYEFDNKPVLINFWATWCPPCIAELPSLQKLYNKYKDDVHFIFIVNEPFEAVEQFLEKRNFSVPFFRLTGNVPDMFETAILPTTYLIDNENIIIHKTGAARWDSGKVMRLLDELIEKKL
jgi:thiol-disulfide isomerase/thioredoxin